MYKKILVLGGYGNFGRLICETLGQRSDIEIIIAGRNLNKAEKFCNKLRDEAYPCKPSSLAVDINTDSFREILSSIHPEIVIHNSGPFQGQGYRVPQACIETGIHYIDLADDRRFVSDFSNFDTLARKNNVIAVSGASSVPGLSSVVVDHFKSEYNLLDTIDMAIVPGSNVDLGKATMKGILSYIGRPFETWERSEWRHRYGWLDTRQSDFGATLGKRWLSNVDIPDLELFPSRYQDVRTVRFQAGHELSMIHLSLAFMAKLNKLGLVKNWDRYSSFFYYLAQAFKKLGSDTGGMVIRLSGKNKDGKEQVTSWRLIAKSGMGPRIPTISTIILANRILDGKLIQAGAYPCLGMYTLDDFFTVAGQWGIYEEVERSLG